MFELICPRCRALISEPTEDEAVKEFSFHCAMQHEDPGRPAPVPQQRRDR